MADKYIIRLNHISKIFDSKKTKVTAVKDISLDIKKGEIFGIMGFSGAGKSTLVRCINLLEHPTAGNVYFQDTDLMSLSNSELRKYRQKMGMIFQQFNLLEQRNVTANVCYPLEIASVKRAQRKARVAELLELVGLSDKALAYPSQLSGGQKQRVAIARALATNPEVLLCDEATSALDPITTKSILELLRQINKTYGVTMVVITHEMNVVKQICDRVAVMESGQITEYGSVRELLSHPKTRAAKNFILIEDDEDFNDLGGNDIESKYD